MAKQFTDSPTITYRPIGFIHSPFPEIEAMPIQPTGAVGIKGTIELCAEFASGLRDLEGFSHVFLIYHFHRSEGYSMVVTPFMDDMPHGVFSTRAPRRPNPIGVSVVKLCAIEGNILFVENIDILDGTPLLDIKPFVPEFDAPHVERIGWLKDVKDTVAYARSDKRFK